MLAAALAAEFGHPVRVADEARFIIRRARLGDAVGMYVPPPLGSGRPGLVLDTLTTGRDREAMFALAIGHHFMRHRTLRRYTYSRNGAMFVLPEEESEAREFAAAFLRAMPIAPVVKRYARG